MREIGSYRFEHNGDCFWAGEEATHWKVYKKFDDCFLFDGGMMTPRGLSDRQLLNHWLGLEEEEEGEDGE